MMENNANSGNVESGGKRMEEGERRIRAITQIYYSNPAVQKAILEFSRDREVVPRYYEGFGKRPDSLQYTSDILGLVKKGATSFHVSEELWQDPLQISSDMQPGELGEKRKGWDLLIDIDSPYFDYSKIAARLMIEALEGHGVKNYGLKFSGNKGFHIIVSGKAFPKEFRGLATAKMFPDWARAISEYLMNSIRKDYNREFGKSIGNKEIERIEKKTKEKFSEVTCPECGRAATKGSIVTFSCPVCGMKIERKNFKPTKRRLKCPNEHCAGVLEMGEMKDYFHCEYCDVSSLDAKPKDEIQMDEEWKEELSAGDVVYPDMVLVSSRHLFRAPYSLHEKTALASVVITKDEIDGFSLKDASPLGIKIRNFMPDNSEGEGLGLLASALEWKEKYSAEEEIAIKRKYSNPQGFEEVNAAEVKEEYFPKPIKKLLKGLKEGKKRGLFILITFLRTLNFSPEYINNKVREWNKLNEPQLKEGYIRSQIDWHLKQRKKVLPPNYSNQSFYKDLGLIDEEPKAKNPVSEVTKRIWANKHR